MDRPHVRILDLDGPSRGGSSRSPTDSAPAGSRHDRGAGGSGPCTLGEFDWVPALAPRLLAGRRPRRDALRLRRLPPRHPCLAGASAGTVQPAGPRQAPGLDGRGIPFLHCGTWLARASDCRVCGGCFTGGETDFDNGYRRLAPWPDLRAGRVVVFPARRRFARGRSLEKVETRPLLTGGGCPGSVARDALRPFLDELARFPLYVSVNKDVLADTDAAVNWDSGLLRLSEVSAVLDAFLEAAGGRLAGADRLGIGPRSGSAAIWHASSTGSITEPAARSFRGGRPQPPGEPHPAVRPARPGWRAGRASLTRRLTAAWRCEISPQPTRFLSSSRHIGNARARPRPPLAIKEGIFVYFSQNCSSVEYKGMQLQP